MNWLLFTGFIFVIHFESADFKKECDKTAERCDGYDVSNCCNPDEKCSLDPDSLLYFCLHQAHLSSNCRDNLDCKVIQSGKCSENGTCICQYDYYANGGWYRPCMKIKIPNQTNSTAFQSYICDQEICELPENSEIRFNPGKYDSKLAYGERCDSDEDCKRYNLSGTACIKGQCRCRSGEVFAYRKLKCQLSENRIGLACPEDKKCPDKNSYCDEFKICRCKELHYYENGACVFDEAYECPENYYFDYFGYEKPRCRRYAQGYGQFCAEDVHCSHLNYSKCVFTPGGKTCDCPSSLEPKNAACLNLLYHG